MSLNKNETMMWALGEAKSTQIDAAYDVLNGSTTSTTTSGESYMDYIDPRIPSWLCLVLLIVGLFGNLVSMWVFYQKSMRKNSTFVYLAFLCWVDSCVLLFGLGDFIVILYFKMILRNQSLVLCRLHTFFTYMFTHLSSFILASVSIDRAIATNLFNFAKFYCKPKTAVRVIILNCVLAVMINFHCLLYLGYKETIYEEKTVYHTTSSTHADDQHNSVQHGNDLNDDDGLKLTSNRTLHAEFHTRDVYECSSKSTPWYDYFMEDYFTLLDLIFYAILPFIIMGICSFFIIRVMFMSNKRLKKTLSYNTSVLVANIKSSSELAQTKASLIGLDNCSTYGGGGGGETSTGRNRSFGESNNGGRRRRRRSTMVKAAGPPTSRLNRTLHLTYTLISINALFFILVSPLVLLRVFIKDATQIDNFKLIMNIIYLLAYSNHSFNFIFYGLSSPPYRECIINLLTGTRATSDISRYRNCSTSTSIRVVRNGTLT